MGQKHRMYDKKAYQRMPILHKMAELNASVEDMKIMYIMFIRSVLEQSAVVWHSSLTQENTQSIERVQKCVAKTILQSKFTTYKKALEFLKIKGAPPPLAASAASSGFCCVH